MRLPGDGDWLFSSEGTCEQHKVIPPGTRDLDCDFATYDDALGAFEGVTVAEGRKLLLDHCEAVVRDAEAKQSTVRDKAKVILGSTAFFLTLLSAAVALIQNWYPAVPLWATLLMLGVFFWVAAHFWRALVLSMRAITRDETIVASTQEIIQSLSGNDAEYKSGRVYQRAAAFLRSAATDTNRLILRRVNLVILAQTSFNWGLRLLPLLFLLYIAIVLVYAGRSNPGVDDLQQLKADVARDMLESERRVLAEIQALRRDVAKAQSDNQASFRTVAGQFTDTTTRIAEVTTALGQLKSQMDTDRRTLQGQLESLGLESTAAAKELDAKIAALTEKITNMLALLQDLQKQQLPKSNGATNEHPGNEQSPNPNSLDSSP